MKRTYYIWLFGGSLLLGIGIFTLFSTFQEGKRAEKQADVLLTLLENHTIPTLEPILEEETYKNQEEHDIPSIVTKKDSMIVEPQILEEPVQQNEIETDELAKKLIGKIKIPSLSIELPILDETTDTLLKVTICRYKGSNPGENGNLVIAGHNYLNGAHFGHLVNIKKGAEVLLYDLEGKEYSYVVDKIRTISPNDVTAVDEYEGESAVTLFTCKEQGTKRFVVSCVEKK